MLNELKMRYRHDLMFRKRVLIHLHMSKGDSHRGCSLPHIEANYEIMNNRNKQRE